MTAALAPADAPPIRAVFSCARLGGDASRKNRLSGFGGISSVTFPQMKANHGGLEAADCFIARGVTIGAGAIMGTPKYCHQQRTTRHNRCGKSDKEGRKGLPIWQALPKDNGMASVLFVSFAPAHSSHTRRMQDAAASNCTIEVYKTGIDKTRQSLLMRMITLDYLRLFISLLRSNHAVWWLWGADACFVGSLAKLIRRNKLLIWDLSDISRLFLMHGHLSRDSPHDRSNTPKASGSTTVSFSSILQ